MTASFMFAGAASTAVSIADCDGDCAHAPVARVVAATAMRATRFMSASRTISIHKSQFRIHNARFGA
jgi:hypothetical protein